MSKDTPISIAVRSIKCVRATGDSGTDEPYVIVVAADVTPTTIPILNQNVTAPRLAVTITGEWHGLNDGDSRGTLPLPPVPDGVSENSFPANEAFVWRKHCWGLDNGKAAKIPDPQNVILLVAVGEQDDSEVSQVRILLLSQMTAALAAQVNVSSTLDHKSLAASLKSSFEDALEMIRETKPTIFQNADEEVGHVTELRLTEDDLHKARHGVHTRQLTFAGDGAKYIVTFEMSPHDGHLPAPK